MMLLVSARVDKRCSWLVLFGAKEREQLLY